MLHIKVLRNTRTQDLDRLLFVEKLYDDSSGGGHLLEAASKSWILIIEKYLFISLAENSLRAELETLLLD